MTKKEKINVLSEAITLSKRDNGDEFYHFTDKAPLELKDLFWDNYEVKDLDYEIFSYACDIVSEIYQDNPKIKDNEATDEIYEQASDCANPYTAAQLAYLDIWNQDEIADLVREMSVDIGTACAIWYNRQVEQASIIIKDWINN